MKSKAAKKSTSNMKPKVEDAKKEETPKLQKQLVETKLQVKKVVPDALNIEKKVQLVKKVPVAPNKIPAKMEKPTINKKPNIPQPEPVIPKATKNQIRLVKNVDKDKKVVAVIVTFHSQASYDHLFTQIEQKAEEGTQVLVYSCNSTDSKFILQAFKKQPQVPIIKQMVEYMNSVDPDCVVFNWQCCSFYGNKKFGEGNDTIFQLLEIIIQKGYMAMFSDFSLKALIAQWREKSLGPNPFCNFSEHSANFTLNFNCEILKSCPSAQLQIIGDMAAEGHCNVQAMASTIVYGVDKTKLNHDIYKLEVLTVATGVVIGQKGQKYQCEINNKKGAAGHVVLTYKSGGCLLTSMGHWIQLMKIDTSEQVLFEVAAREFGQEKAKSMKMEYDQLDVASKKAYVSRNAVQFVQSQAPCKNMSKKAKKF